MRPVCSNPHLVQYHWYHRSMYLSCVCAYMPPMRFLFLLLIPLGCHWIYCVLRPCPGTVSKKYLSKPQSTKKPFRRSLQWEFSATSARVKLAAIKAEKLVEGERRTSVLQATSTKNPFVNHSIANSRPLGILPSLNRTSNDDNQTAASEGDA